MAEKKSLKEKLQKIQLELKAPKDLKNTFGNYNYRNAESIFEAFKPIGDKYKAFIEITDEIVFIGTRYYVKATATLHDCESDEVISASALAREEETKKGMDSAQLTGATSSYARKYALNGLLLLDDTKDQDSDEYVKETQARAKYQPKAQASSREELESELYACCNANAIAQYLNAFKVENVSDLTDTQIQRIIDRKKEGK